MSELQVGQHYKVTSRRKGTFSGKLIRIDSDFATFAITGGRASAMQVENEREVGEEVDVRISFCTFELSGAAAPAPAAVPVERFGKDHWSLLAYVESCCVDGKSGIGTLDRRRLRCNDSSHTALSGAYSQLVKWRTEYGTRLAGYFEFDGRSDAERAIEAGVQLRDHDDWDCLDDLESAGYVRVLSRVNGLVSLTGPGIEEAGALRAHKIAGKHFAQYAATQGGRVAGAQADGVAV